jgi:predicted O-linked N-acetylglucosamine transferase (SPINDLY family)
LPPPANDAGCYREQGEARHDAGEFAEALELYRQSLACDPQQPQVWFATGCAQTSLKEFADAAFSFRSALQINRAWPQAQHNLARTLFELGQIEDAACLFREVASSDVPELPLRALAVIVPGNPADDHAAILETRRQWGSKYLPPARAAGQSVKREKVGGESLRIGYLSSFFHRENWMKPVWGLINRHDRARVEVHLFSDAPASQIKTGYRPQARDRFHDISRLSNEQAAVLIENAGLHLLIDLNAYSAVSRLPLLAMRPAPVVAGWFNAYATTGIPAYDYLIGDEHVILPAEEKFYCEKIVRVPGSYLTFETTYAVPPVSPSPWQANCAITFGCLASQYKITNHVVDAWCRILQGVPESTLLLRNAALTSPSNCRFVLEMFESRGVSGARVQFRGRADHYRFLQTYDEIDVALDTFPYNGGTTTTEAIWQGVPVVTFGGDRWASRTSASILRAGHLGEFVADGIPNYIALAIRLGTDASNRHYLAELRRTMRQRLCESPVCDTSAFARNMEQLYEQMTGVYGSANA